MAKGLFSYFFTNENPTYQHEKIRGSPVAIKFVDFSTNAVDRCLIFQGERSYYMSEAADGSLRNCNRQRL
jgi:hypothetical protein